MDNRPLKWDEFLSGSGRPCTRPATPGLTMSKVDSVVEQTTRHGAGGPGGGREAHQARSTTSWSRSSCAWSGTSVLLATTLTKRMAEDLTEYLMEHG
ncbi:hypothetical protein QJS66_02685 [Kocuria rhizophila]|nr:hypothetical protein QJS66_02685 [Kocuria rhizophila]